MRSVTAKSEAVEMGSRRDGRTIEPCIPPYKAEQRLATTKNLELKMKGK